MLQDLKHIHPTEGLHYFRW